jgi:hypothetical protein
MHGPVALDQVRALGPRQLAEGVLQRLGGQGRVEPPQRIAQPPADALQPGESGLFDDGFGERRHGASHSARIGTA